MTHIIVDIHHHHPSSTYVITIHHRMSIINIHHHHTSPSYITIIHYHCHTSSMFMDIMLIHTFIESDKSATRLTGNGNEQTRIVTDKKASPVHGWGTLTQRSWLPVPIGVWQFWRRDGVLAPVDKRRWTAPAPRSWGTTPAEASVVDPDRPRKVQFSEQLVQSTFFYKSDRPSRIAHVN